MESLVEFVLPVIVLGKVRSAEHDEGVQPGCKGGGGDCWPGRVLTTEMDQLRGVGRRRGRDELSLLDLFLYSAALNRISENRPGHLPRSPTVLSGQQPLQEENLGGKEGRQGSLRSPVTLHRGLLRALEREWVLRQVQFLHFFLPRELFLGLYLEILMTVHI